METPQETNIQAKLSVASPESISDYFAAARRINETLPSAPPRKEKTIRVALLSSFTTKGLKETLLVESVKVGIFPSFYEADYNQFAQEITNQKSGLYQFNPELIILFLDVQSLLSDLYFNPYSSERSSDERRRWTESTLKNLELFLETIKRQSNAKIIIHNFELPTYSPLGILESKQTFGLHECVEMLNSSLKASYRSDSQIFVFDYNQFCAQIGTKSIRDPKMYYLADMKLDLRWMPSLARQYIAYIKAFLCMTKKCIVLDLDQILWGGIAGEDGLRGIRLGPDPAGLPFLEFQKHLLALLQKGVILAINSRNNPDDALNIIRNHPYMILKEDSFSSIQINWNDKASNMQIIAKELNIGLDSFVFLDDDPSNRSLVQMTFPEILVPEMPQDPALYVSSLLQLSSEFNTLQLTKEDTQKSKLYAEQKERSKFAAKHLELGEYLTQLEIEVSLDTLTDFNLSRIAQLTQKTNQFNMTTRRYQIEDIQQFRDSGNFLVVAASLRDKFGDSGIIGAAIVEKEGSSWRIDTFLLSCRALGKGVEDCLLTYILEHVQLSKASEVIGEFIETSKNAPARGFYKEKGFDLLSKVEGLESWKLTDFKKCSFPSYIKIKKL